MLNSVRDYFRLLNERFGAGWNRFWFTPSDPMTLSVLRIATGLVALYWYFLFSFDLINFFGAQGLLSAETVAAWARESGAASSGFPTLDRLSYLSYVADPTALWILHGLGFVVLIAFTAGLLTRYASIGSLVISLSYMHRAPFLSWQLQPVMVMVLFYLCLGPCGACLSIDALLRRRRERKEGETQSARQQSVQQSSWATVAARLLQLHLTALCLMIGLSQLGGLSNVWWTGEASWMLAARQESFLPMTWLRGQAYLIDMLTHAILWFHLLFPLLVWWPLARPIALTAAVVNWTMLALLTGLTAFCLMMFIASLAFVRPASFRTLLRRNRSKQSEANADQPENHPAGGNDLDDASASQPRKEISKSAKLSRRPSKTK